MTFAHPLRGTCVPGCRLYGLCHCGCGRRTTLVAAAHKRKAAELGLPRVFVNNHHAPPKYSRSGIPAGLIRADLEEAIRQFGTGHRVGELIGRSDAWISHVRKGRIRRVHLAFAHRIAELARGTRSSLPDAAVIRNTKNKRAERARKAVA